MPRHFGTSDDTDVFVSTMSEIASGRTARRGRTCAWRSDREDWRTGKIGGRTGEMVGQGGLEPPTLRLSGVRSNHLSYEPISIRVAFVLISSPFGGDEEDRTPDPLRARQVLSQLSYTPIFLKAAPSKLNSIHSFPCTDQCYGLSAISP